MASALQRIAQFPNPTAAALFISVLEAHGIPALLRNDNMATLGYPGLNPVGVELMVDENDFDRACAILNQGSESAETEDEDAFTAPPTDDDTPYE